jgi:hypothetical protein
MTLSDQALSCVMVALQKSLLEQADIVPTLKSFDLVLEDGELIVANPPVSMKMKDMVSTEEE